VEGGLGPLDDSNAMIDDAQQLFVPHRLPARFTCLIVEVPRQRNCLRGCGCGAIPEQPHT
jgi:hypothetical protein